MGGMSRGASAQTSTPGGKSRCAGATPTSSTARPPTRNTLPSTGAPPSSCCQAWWLITAVEPPRLAEAGDDTQVEVPRRQRAEAARLAPPVEEVRRRDRPPRVLRRHLVERRQPLRLGERQRRDEQRMHGAPHRRADADAEGKDGDDG